MSNSAGSDDNIKKDDSNNKSSSSTSNSNSNSSINSKVDLDQFLTPAELRHKKRQLELEQTSGTLAQIANTSFRERVGKFNEGLAKLTEHNDIPRISAAGNG